MIRFLLNRPIAVIMAFLAFFIIGLITYFTIPVSLLPDIAIPEITVQVAGANTSARELENTVVKPIRQELMQVGHLRDITSETRDGQSIIKLNFDYGTDTDLAFIEVNEKIDASMSRLPRSVERPRVIKASATDIPVFCLNLTLKDDAAFEKTNETKFLGLCEFAETVIKRRIEQLPEVAMVDVTGVMGQQLQIVPDMDKLKMTGITLNEIEGILAANNVEPGSMIVRDGFYEYNIKFSSLLRTLEDVQNIYINKNGRIYQLKDIAQVDLAAQKQKGASFANGKRAVTLAVIKQADENIANMQASLDNVIGTFGQMYPDIEFSITRNQTELLNYTISNLKQNLLLGFVFICIVAVLFLGDVKSPAVIGISMVVSIVISFLFFYLFKMSLNIISLSGLILALGMMIDSSIIVTENITQYREKGLSLDAACEKGTDEVITPMLSSSLTTIAVFVPLVFMSGIAGAIFFDQAFSVTVGLMVSYFTGIMLLPVLYKMIYSMQITKRSLLPEAFHRWTQGNGIENWYERGLHFAFHHKFLNLVICVIVFPICVFMFYFIPKERMPQIDEVEMIAKVEWNENIHLDESSKRVSQLFSAMDTIAIEHNGYVGMQQFLLNKDKELSTSESELYFKTKSTQDIARLEKNINAWLKMNYPFALVSFSPPPTIFEKIFVTGEADLVAEFYPKDRKTIPTADQVKVIANKMEEQFGHKPLTVPFQEQIDFSIDKEKLLLYNIPYNQVYQLLKTAFMDNNIAMLRSFQQFLPISLEGRQKTVNQILNETLVEVTDPKTRAINYIPINELISTRPAEDFKTITAGKNGEFIPFSFYSANSPEQIIDATKAEYKQGNDWDISFSGSFFSNQKMLNELVVILLVSIMLMYFILAAQFESFMQPLIVLIEIPIDVAAALVLLWLCGHTLNLMSAIGIVVTCGIIINDSILKIDAINELRKGGMPLMDAIHEAGKRRLRPIVMTSLTTIFAMVPLLFTSDFGSELQKPLAIAMIGAMAVGTIVSLFVIPLAYWFIYGRKVKTVNA